MDSTQGMQEKTRVRIPEIDLFRAFVLLYMAFVNLYYSLSKVQLPFLSHHGKVMSGGDVLIVYFFLMLGFNLVLVQKFKKLHKTALLFYAWKRGLLLILIGMVLISYQFIPHGFKVLVFFRSFLVVLGLGLLLISFLALFMQFRTTLVLIVALLFTCQMFFFTIELDYEINYLTPYFLLSSIWGYYFGLIFLEPEKKYYKISLRLIIFCLVLAFLHIFFLHSIPSRQTMNAPYFFISWAVILGSFSIFRKSGVSRKFFSNARHLKRIGSHPLSFWIIQSLVIALAVILSTLVYYAQNNSLSFFWGFPYRLRSIGNLPLSIFIAVAATLVIALLHSAYVSIFSKRKIY